RSLEELLRVAGPDTNPGARGLDGVGRSVRERLIRAGEAGPRGASGRRRNAALGMLRRDEIPHRHAGKGRPPTTADGRFDSLRGDDPDALPGLADLHDGRDDVRAGRRRTSSAGALLGAPAPAARPVHRMVTA